VNEKEKEEKMRNNERKEGTREKRKPERDEHLVVVARF
jgi:hypothetical protein